MLEHAIDISAALRGGIYILRHRGAIVYIGKAKVMLTRIYSHRKAWGDRRQRPANRELPEWFPIKGIMFDSVSVLPVEPAHVDRIERELIQRYQPRYNIQHKPKQSLAGMVIGGVEFPAQKFERRI